MRKFDTRLLKEIVVLAIPIGFFNLTITFISIANGLMLANLGPSAFAAGALIGIIQTSLMMMCSSPLFAISSIVSRMHAQRKFFQIGSLLQQGYLLALLLSIPIIMVILLIKPILNSLGQQNNVINFVDLYFKSYLWGVPSSMLLTCSQQFMLGLKRTRLITVVGSFSLIISVSVGYILAFGKMGFYPMGIVGLGYSQTARSVITLLFLASFFVFQKEFKIFSLNKMRPFNKLLYLRKIFVLGWPISIHAASEYLAIFSVTLFAGKLGQMELIAQQIAAQYILFLSIPMLAFSQAANILVSTSIGNHEWQKMRDYSYLSIILGFSIGFIAIISFLLFTKTLLSPYITTNNNIDLILILKPFLLITLFGQLLGAGKTISTGILRALYDTRIPMILSLITVWGIVVPFAYISVFILHWGLNGLAIAQTTGMGVCTLLLLDRWKTLSFNISNPSFKKKTIFYKVWIDMIYPYTRLNLKTKGT